MLGSKRTARKRKNSRALRSTRGWKQPRSAVRQECRRYAVYSLSAGYSVRTANRSGRISCVYRRATLAKNVRFWSRNVIFKFLPKRKIKEYNTQAYKRMIDEYPIDFIGHLNRGIIADAVEVAKYAHERGVYIELNGRHKVLPTRKSNKWRLAAWSLFAIRTRTMPTTWAK